MEKEKITTKENARKNPAKKAAKRTVSKKNPRHKKESFFTRLKNKLPLINRKKAKKVKEAPKRVILKDKPKKVAEITSNKRVNKRDKFSVADKDVEIKVRKTFFSRFRKKPALIEVEKEADTQKNDLSSGKIVELNKIAGAKASIGGEKGVGDDNQPVEKAIEIMREIPNWDKSRKPKVAIVSLTSCEGCQFVLLDLGERFLGLTEKIELVDFRLVEDEEDEGKSLDIALVEGNPVTEANMETLKRIRGRAKILVAMGNCAAMGGIPEIKNYHERNNTVKHVYRYLQGIANTEIHELDNFVKVDFVFPGCPIDGEEFLKYLPFLLEGKIPQIPDNPVCTECKKAGNRCLLLDKKPCFGPMILGGCNAVCPTSRMGCQGCRGLRPTGNVKAMRGALKNMMTDEEFENTTEIYGLRDDVEEREKFSN